MLVEAYVVVSAAMGLVSVVSAVPTDKHLAADNAVLQGYNA